MILSLLINNRSFKFNADEPIDLGIPLDFYGAQPNAFGVERASAAPCEAGTMIGDTRRGGSCNFEQVTFIPHCNGTHTECVGHITDERISIHDCLKDAFVPARLVSVEPENACATNETYAVQLDETDKLITRTSLEKQFELAEKDLNFEIANSEPEALIVRTLPNDEEKKTRAYMENPPPFFSAEAMNFIAERGVKHLLVDLPSIDRTFDEGKLSNHRVFWNVEPGRREIPRGAGAINKTITEMIFVPDAAADGFYLLNLQIAAFVADAAPSRPLLFRML